MSVVGFSPAVLLLAYVEDELPEEIAMSRLD
jgi:hypothetical protein